MLYLDGLSKSFPGTRALSDVDLDVRGGEIHALVGANGSGKSTLVKILAGVYRPDGGVIRVGDRVFGGGLSPSEARAVGLHFVHQDLAVFTDLSVADNIAIGRGFDTDPLVRIRWRSVRRHTSRVLDRFHIAARPDTPVGALRPSDRTMVAIARALQDQEGQDSGVLVLDEPTTSLPDADVGLLIAALRRFAEAGQSMLFISHDIDEALSFVDRVSVLRDGRKVATLDAPRADRDQVVELITGRPVGRLYPAPQRPDGGARLQVRNVSVGPVRDVSFDVLAGEIVGLAGLIGSGASEILQAIFRARPPRGGSVAVDGAALGDRPRDAIAAGVSYLPAERSRAGFFDAGVRENLSAPEVARYWKYLFMSMGRERADARATIARFGIRATSEEQNLALLSGGNQQKVMLARWLRRDPRVLLLDEPTQGVDVGARAEVYELIRAAADRGTAVLLVTVDFEEIAGLCDRALVINDGRVVAELHKPGIDHQRLTELALRRLEKGTTP